MNIVRSCRNIFNCDDYYKSVYTFSNDEKIRWNKFLVYPILPNQPDINTDSRLRLLFLHYATLHFSCFGAWLGISVLGLNPSKWKQVQPISRIAHEPVVSDRISPMYQTIRLLLETEKQQQEWMVQMDQELAKLATKKIPVLIFIHFERTS